MLDRSFCDKVTAVVRALRPGQVVSYGEVAVRAGHPGAARAVGNVLAVSSGLPWWRVVRGDGRLASNDTRRQTELLRQEGVAVWSCRIAHTEVRRRLPPDLAGGS